MGKYTIKLSDLNSVFKEIEQEVNYIAEKAYVGVRDKLPEDTYELTSSVKLKSAERKGKTVTASVYADPDSPSIEYAEYIEYGVPSGDTRRYYKDSGRRLGGTPYMVSQDGTQAYQRTKLELEELIKNRYV